jgi:uncharacterized MAPEG superfamily protein
MTFAYWCVALAAFLPLVWVGAAKVGGTDHDYDNARPRIFLANLSGWPQRANWAQANAYEAFPPFAAAVIIAGLAGANQAVVDALAGLSWSRASFTASFIYSTGRCSDHWPGRSDSLR